MGLKPTNRGGGGGGPSSKVASTGSSRQGAVPNTTPASVDEGLGLRSSAGSSAAEASLDRRKMEGTDSREGCSSVGSRLCLFSFFSNLTKTYSERFTPRILMMDAFIASLLMMAGLLVVYVFLVRTAYPFNTFLAAFISCVGTAVLTICLRSQITNKDVFKVSEERAFADFLICNLLLQLAVFNYIG